MCWRLRTRWNRRAYPLPEAQLDRFLMQVDVTYPDHDAERRMLIATTGNEEEPAVAVLNPTDLLAAAADPACRWVAVVEGILDLVRSAGLKPRSLKRFAIMSPGDRVPAPVRR